MDIEQRLQLAIMAHGFRADLRAADQTFRNHKELWEWAATFKLAAVTLGNVVDLEPLTRQLYIDNQELSATFKQFEKEAQFARYLRNTFAAHKNEELVRQAIAWRPEIRMFVSDIDETKSTLIDLFVLETAINTYIAEDGSHKIFDGETDLVYPPDVQRFNAYLEKTVTGALSYLDMLIRTLLAGYTPPNWEEEGLQLAAKAGKMDFGFVTKGKR